MDRLIRQLWSKFAYFVHGDVSVTVTRGIGWPSLRRIAALPPEMYWNFTSSAPSAESVTWSGYCVAQLPLFTAVNVVRRGTAVVIASPARGRVAIAHEKRRPVRSVQVAGEMRSSFVS